MCSGNGSQVSHSWLNGRGRMSPEVLDGNQRNPCELSGLIEGIGQKCVWACVCAHVCVHVQARQAQICLLRGTETPVAMSTPTPKSCFLNAFLHKRNQSSLETGQGQNKRSLGHRAVPKSLCSKNGVISKGYGSQLEPVSIGQMIQTD